MVLYRLYCYYYYQYLKQHTVHWLAVELSICACCRSSALWAQRSPRCFLDARWSHATNVGFLWRLWQCAEDQTVRYDSQPCKCSFLFYRPICLQVVPGFAFIAQAPLSLIRYGFVLGQNAVLQQICSLELKMCRKSLTCSCVFHKMQKTCALLNLPILGSSYSMLIRTLHGKLDFVMRAAYSVKRTFFYLCMMLDEFDYTCIIILPLGW